MTEQLILEAAARYHTSRCPLDTVSVKCSSILKANQVAIVCLRNALGPIAVYAKCGKRLLRLDPVGVDEGGQSTGVQGRVKAYWCGGHTRGMYGFIGLMRLKDEMSILRGKSYETGKDTGQCDPHAAPV